MKRGLYGLSWQNSYFTTFQTSNQEQSKKKGENRNSKMESKRKVCVRANLKQAIYYKEQRKAKEIITRKNRKTRVHLCAHLSICPDVCRFECISESNEVQPGQKGYWNGFKVAQSLSALSPSKQGGRLACCSRADKVFLMALKCIIYFEKLAFVLFSEKRFEKRCSTVCTFLLGQHFQWLTQRVLQSNMINN